MNNTTDSMTWTISPVERLKLISVCRELGIDMTRYPIDRDLINAITAAIWRELEIEENPDRGFYEI